MEGLLELCNGRYIGMVLYCIKDVFCIDLTYFFHHNKIKVLSSLDYENL